MLKKIDKDGSGDIDVKEFYAFAKRDYGEFVAARLKAVLRAAGSEAWRPARRRVPRVGFERDGMISPSELRSGLDALGVFKGVQDADAQKLLNRIDLDASGNLSLAEF